MMQGECKARAGCCATRFTVMCGQIHCAAGIQRHSCVLVASLLPCHHASAHARAGGTLLHCQSSPCSLFSEWLWLTCASTDFQVKQPLPIVSLPLTRNWASNIAVDRAGFPNHTLFCWAWERENGSLTAGPGDPAGEPWGIWLNGVRSARGCTHFVNVGLNARPSTERAYPRLVRLLRPLQQLQLAQARRLRLARLAGVGYFCASLCLVAHNISTVDPDIPPRR
jgi:hypothetical protein